MTLSEIMNIVLGGGLIAAVIAIATLRATVRKANADAAAAIANAKLAETKVETVRITNTEQATRILVENIVEPLRKELYESRKEQQATKRALSRLERALAQAIKCPYADVGCIVLEWLREQKSNRADGDRAPDGNRDEPEPRNKADP